MPIQNPFYIGATFLSNKNNLKKSAFTMTNFQENMGKQVLLHIMDVETGISEWKNPYYQELQTQLERQYKKILKHCPQKARPFIETLLIEYDNLHTTQEGTDMKVGIFKGLAIGLGLQQVLNDPVWAFNEWFKDSPSPKEDNI